MTMEWMEILERKVIQPIRNSPEFIEWIKAERKKKLIKVNSYISRHTDDRSLDRLLRKRKWLQKHRARLRRERVQDKARVRQAA